MKHGMESFSVGGFAKALGALLGVPGGAARTILSGSRTATRIESFMAKIADESVGVANSLKTNAREAMGVQDVLGCGSCMCTHGRCVI